MKDCEHDDDDGAAEPEATPVRPPRDRWKAMPDGDAKRAAYLEQARERQRRERESGAIARSPRAPRDGRTNG